MSQHFKSLRPRFAEFHAEFDVCFLLQFHIHAEIANVKTHASLWSINTSGYLHENQSTFLMYLGSQKRDFQENSYMEHNTYSLQMFWVLFWSVSHYWHFTKRPSWQWLDIYFAKFIYYIWHIFTARVHRFTVIVKNWGQFTWRVTCLLPATLLSTEGIS
jgi:hypothetical protein